MKAQSEHLFRRGQRGTFYLRKRIPLHLRDAYPRGKAEVLVSLRTSDEQLAKERLRAQRGEDIFAADGSGNVGDLLPWQSAVRRVTCHVVFKLVD